jgi:magnesium transporter
MFKTMTVCPTTHQVTTAEGAESVYPPIDRLRWIDLTKQDAGSIGLLGERFRFHPLTLEDCLHFDQRPKLESYDDYDFLVVHGYQINWEAPADSQALELHIFITRNFIITIHEQPMPMLESLWNKVSADARLVSQGTDYMCYLILDGLMDTYFPQISDVEMKIDSLEDRVLNSATDVELEEIINFKRLLLDLRRILLPQRDVIGILTRHTNERFTGRVELYMRDLYDHALRLHSYIENSRELVSNLRDAHLWAASQRTNEIMKRLTILSAIFMPLTFMTGFFGQNFSALPVENNNLYYLTIGACVVVPIAMLIYFIRSKWF